MLLFVLDFVYFFVIVEVRSGIVCSRHVWWLISILDVLCLVSDKV
jgi:hypothetical protein